MICNKCGHESTEHLIFCTKCGTKLVEEEAFVEENGAEEAVITETTGEEIKEATEDVQDAVEQTEAATEVAVVEEVEKVEDVTVEDALDKKNKKAKKIKAIDLSEKKPMDKKKLLLALVAILLLVFIPVALNSGDKPYMEFADKAVKDIVELDNDGILYAQLRDGSAVKLDDKVCNNVVYSMDRSVMCYTNEEDELVLIKDGEVLLTGIEEAQEVVVSEKGTMLAYFSDCKYLPYQDGSFKNIGTLHLYHIKKGETTKIAEEVVVGSTVLSPNGKTVAYVAEYEAADNFKGFYSINGKKPVEVGKEMHVFAISDKGEYVYYTDIDRIYVKKKNKNNEAERLASGVYDVTVMMNADRTEMLFSDGGKTYVTEKAGEKSEVSSVELNVTLLDSDAASERVRLSTERGYIDVSYTGVDTFREKVFFSEVGDHLLYMSEQLQTERLASDVDGYAIANDGQSLVYIDNRDIVKVTEFESGGKKELFTKDEEVNKLYADGGLKYVYFVNAYNELYCTKGKKAKKIADDVTSVAVSADGKNCYYVVEGETFCYSKKNGKGKTLFEAGENRISCSRNGEEVFFEVTGHDLVEVFAMDGKEMKKYSSSEPSYDDIYDIFDSIFG